MKDRDEVTPPDRGRQKELLRGSDLRGRREADWAVGEAQQRSSVRGWLVAVLDMVLGTLTIALVSLIWTDLKSGLASGAVIAGGTFVLWAIVERRRWKRLGDRAARHRQRQCEES